MSVLNIDRMGNPIKAGDTLEYKAKEYIVRQAKDEYLYISIPTKTDNKIIWVDKAKDDIKKIDTLF